MNPTIEHNFKYHPPIAADPGKHAQIRAKARELAELIDGLLPAAAALEKAVAITKCEEAMMWACAGICRHPVSEPASPAKNCSDDEARQLVSQVNVQEMARHINLFLDELRWFNEHGVAIHLSPKPNGWNLKFSIPDDGQSGPNNRKS
jgi:hypothetical protein